ncbi:MAG: NADP-dependent malic enzyme [Candidatus Spechtbacterales bacterium]
MSLRDDALAYHKLKRGKIGISLKRPVTSRRDLSLAYTPGVAEVSKAIAKNKDLARDYTNKGNSVAIVSDGTATLGLGNVGPEAALPVMEGKAALFKAFAGVDAYPLCIDETDPKKIIALVKALAPSFAGINLEDISAPRCFEIERTLKRELDIPVFHDDQHGAAVVILAALINALRVVGKDHREVRVVLNGAGAAGIATAHLLLAYGIRHLVVIDKHGVLHSRQKGMHAYQRELAKLTKPKVRGGLKEALVDADVFIGLSVGNILTKEMVAAMAPRAIVFAAANPTPEIHPDKARAAGAAVIATGRSDFPNQINNAIVFPGLFRGLLDARATEISTDTLLCIAGCLAKLIAKPTASKIIPSIFDKRTVKTVAHTVPQVGVCNCLY